MKTPEPKDWKCQECGKRMTLKAAEKVTSTGCLKCGGVDIDLEDVDDQYLRAVCVASLKGGK